MRAIAGPALAIATAALWASCGPAVAARYLPAEERMAAGAYEDAERAFRDLLVETPDDPTARAGVTRARRAALARTLSECRAHLAAGRGEAALEGLLGLVAREREWMLEAPPGQEEVEAGVQAFVAREVDRLQAERRLLLARALLERARDAFRTPDDLARHRFRLDGVIAAGAKHCESMWLMASARSPFFAAFAARYCAAWGAGREVPEALLDRQRAEMVSDVSFTSSVGGLMPEEADALAKAIRGAVAASAWHDQHGRLTLSIGIRGGVAFSRIGAPHIFVQPYIEQVPFQAMEEYCEWVQTPVTTRSGDDEATTYVSECVRRERTVTRYRGEPREYRYQGERFRQSMQATIEVTSTVAGLPIRVERRDAAEETDVAHWVDRPEIGVRPDPLTLTSRAEWVRRQVDAVAAELRARLDEAWVSWHCIPLDGAPMDAVAEQVFRCLHATASSPPPFVDEWFVAQMGAGAREVLDMLQRYGSPRQ